MAQYPDNFGVTGPALVPDSGGLENHATADSQGAAATVYAQNINGPKTAPSPVMQVSPTGATTAAGGGSTGTPATLQVTPVGAVVAPVALPDASQPPIPPAKAPGT